ncbi:MAG: ATP-binding protein [Treponema sp.]|nr:ATP-binding protein [Treponema sp.]
MTLDKFNKYYGQANNEKNACNFAAAKRAFYLASKCLLEVALSSEDELKIALLNRANKIISYADLLLAETQEQQNHNPSENKPESAFPKEEDDEECVKFAPAEVPDISFDDIAGLEDVKQTIRRRVINAIKHPEIYEANKKRAGGGVLMFGLPGTGKTMIAKAVANEVNAKFYSIKCSDIVSKWVGDTEKNIKELFDTARKEKVAVIFFDEFDGLAPSRSTRSTVMPRAVNELLNQIDGFSKPDNILLLLAATNRPWDIDSGILRSGRFSERIEIPLPDADARRYILKRNFADLPIAEDLDFDDLVAKTDNFNGADIAEFCNRCTDARIERQVEIKEAGGDYNNEIITKNDIYGVLCNFKSSVKPGDKKRLKRFVEENK